MARFELAAFASYATTACGDSGRSRTADRRVAACCLRLLATLSCLHIYNMYTGTVFFVASTRISLGDVRGEGWLRQLESNQPIPGQNRAHCRCAMRNLKKLYKIQNASKAFGGAGLRILFVLRKSVQNKMSYKTNFPLKCTFSRPSLRLKPR